MDRNPRRERESDIHVYHHLADDILSLYELNAMRHREVIRMLNDISQQNISEKELLMATAAEMKSDLLDAKNVTDEIASDLDTLIEKQVLGGLTKEEADEVASQIKEQTARLRGVAAKYTPETPVDPPVEVDPTTGLRR